MDAIAIAGPGLSATISSLGAELQTLRDNEGRDLLWHGDPAVWAGRAPILFPIVGALNGGAYTVDGQVYRMPQHGFARRRTFSLIEHDASSARFRLDSDDETRAIYPFDFILDVTFAIDDATLTIAAELTNPDTVRLPASFGFHPAFAWPLPYGRPRDAHRLVFAAQEPGPVRRLAGGLLDAADLPTPIEGRILPLTDGLFAADALILEAPASRAIYYGAADAPELEIAWDGLPGVAVWSKPDAGFVCVEPWQGHADPVGFEGDFRDKPGVIAVAPGETRRFVMTVTLFPE
jgi:galactose mutarotase-like enzyme